MYLLDVRAWMCSDLVFLERCHFFLYCSNMVNPTVDRCLSGNSYSEWMIMDGHYIIIKLWMVILYIYIVFNIMIWHNYKYLYYIILQLYTIKCISVYMYIIIHNYIYRWIHYLTNLTWSLHLLNFGLVAGALPTAALRSATFQKRTPPRADAVAWKRGDPQSPWDPQSSWSSMTDWGKPPHDWTHDLGQF